MHFFDLQKCVIFSEMMEVIAFNFCLFVILKITDVTIWILAFFILNLAK